MSNTLEETRNILRKTALLAAMPDILLDALAVRAQERHYTRGEMVCREGDNTKSMYLISRGEVDVYKHRNGREFQLARFGPGEPFGEMSLIDDSPRSASVRAVSDELLLLELQKQDVLDILQLYPPALYETLKLLNTRLRLADSERVHELQQKYDELAEANRRLQKSYNATLAALSHALDLRDQSTEGHSQRVTAYSLTIAESLGLNAECIEAVRLGALLHDIGKIGVSDAILRKPGPLTDEERKEMRNHPTWGKRIIEGIDFLAPAMDVVYSHHERWDGRGYPLELSGEQIPLAARIFAIADVFDALTMERPYKSPWTPEAARDQIVKDGGTAFDPRVVEVFLKVFTGMSEVMYKSQFVELDADAATSK